MTNTATMIKISSVSDALEARLAAREQAYHTGFSLEDQAYVALAAWTMTIVLGLGVNYHGDINIKSCERAGREGIKILCRVECDERLNQDEIDQGDLHSLVDEISILPPDKKNGLKQLVAIIWKKSVVTGQLV